MKIITYFNIAFLIVSMASCSSKDKNTETSASSNILDNAVTLTVAQQKNMSLALGKLQEKNISSNIRVSGKIDVPPQNMVSVSMPLGGYLKSTKLLPGMHVRKGEVIATMEDLQYIQLQQDYLTTQTKLLYAEIEFNRQKELNQSKASSDKVFQQAQMEYSSQKIALSALAEKLKLININPTSLSEKNLSKSVSLFSPIDGYVSKVNVNIGKNVDPSDVLFELVNTSDIHLNIKVFEKDLEKLSIGQRVMAFNNQSDKKHLCEIILISQDLSPERTAEVHCHFTDYDKNLLPGMYMNAEIETKQQQVLAINEEAIVNFEAKNYVFVKNNEQYVLTEVQLGDKENGFIQVLNPDELKNKELVTKGAYTLLMKLKNKEDE